MIFSGNKLTISLVISRKKKITMCFIWNLRCASFTWHHMLQTMIKVVTHIYTECVHFVFLSMNRYQMLKVSRIEKNISRYEKSCDVTRKKEDLLFHSMRCSHRHALCNNKIAITMTAYSWPNHIKFVVSLHTIFILCLSFVY